MWLLVEIGARVASWLAGLFGRDMENDEWERGAGADRLPAGDDLVDLPEDTPR